MHGMHKTASSSLAGSTLRFAPHFIRGSLRVNPCIKEEVFVINNCKESKNPERSRAKLDGVEGPYILCLGTSTFQSKYRKILHWHYYRSPKADN